MWRPTVRWIRAEHEEFINSGPTDPSQALRQNLAYVFASINQPKFLDLVTYEFRKVASCIIYFVFPVENNKNACLWFFYIYTFCFVYHFFYK